MGNVGLMPLLNWYCYEQIFNCLTNFATDFGNGKIMSKACPFTKLNTSALVCTLTVLKTFCSQINFRDKKKLNSEVRVGQIDFPSKFGKLELVFFTKKQSLES
jgi:hypothetical protein